MRFKVGQVITSLDSQKTYLITDKTKSTYYTHLIDDKEMTYAWNKWFVETGFFLTSLPKTRYICMDCGKRALTTEETKNHHLECKEE